jgi:hypothetical protein
MNNMQLHVNNNDVEIIAIGGANVYSACEDRIIEPPTYKVPLVNIASEVNMTMTPLRAGLRSLTTDDVCHTSGRLRCAYL